MNPWADNEQRNKAKPKIYKKPNTCTKTAITLCSLLNTSNCCFCGFISYCTGVDR